MALSARSMMDDSMIGRWLCEKPFDKSSGDTFVRPLLRRFIHHAEPIKKRKYIGGGEEGQVYLIKVAGKRFVLKIFRYWSWPFIWKCPLKESKQPYMTPFSHECRAFARLHSLGQNGTWAVKCYGWMKLTDEQIKPFEHWQVPNLSPWAIVKEYIPEDFTLGDVPEIRRKMIIARKARLYPDDIKPENHRGSFLVDLGQVKTYPYPEVFWSDDRRRKSFKQNDEVISEWELCIRDGVTIVSPWQNELQREEMCLAKARKEEEAMKKRKVEESQVSDHEAGRCSKKLSLQQEQGKQE